MRPLGISVLSLALVAAVSLTGCGSSDGGDKGAASSSPSSTTAPDEHHKIVVTWDDPVAGTDDGYVGQVVAGSDTSPQAFAESILEKGAVEGIADGFASNIILPTDLKIHVRNDEGSPYYDPSTKTVNIFYDFANLTADIIKATDPTVTDADLGTQWAAVNDFVLVHELAHAFVDVLKKEDGSPGITVTGREEDAADGMATYFFTNYVDGGPGYAFAAASFFAALQDFQGSPDATQFADEHSLSIQRAGDIACKVAGSSEANMAEIQSRGVLPDSRLARCPDEYQQMSDVWSSLLKPFIRAQSGS